MKVKYTHIFLSIIQLDNLKNYFMKDYQGMSQI